MARPGLAAHQKKARRKGAVIVFVDEAGFSYQLGVDTTWAPRGRTPVQKRMSKRRQVSTAIGLTMSGRIYKKHFDHAIHGEGMVEHLKHLRRRIAGPMIIVWDGLQVHRSGPVKAFLAEHGTPRDRRGTTPLVCSGVEPRGGLSWERETRDA